MKVSWANSVKTMALVDDDSTTPHMITTMPADPRNPPWAAILARVTAGELTIADYAPPTPPEKQD